MKVVMVFGTFDGLHDGHRFFLREARRQGSVLIVVVAQDAVAKNLKRRLPMHSLSERLEALQKSGLANQTIAGDTKLGKWSAISTFQPNVVAVGYDQNHLEGALREFIAKENLSVALVKISAYGGDRLHSRFLRK